MIAWRERGGPPVTTPTRRGLGTTVLERALRGTAGGRTEVEWLAEGLVCRLWLGGSAAI